MSQSRRCQISILALRAVRSTLHTKASTQTMADASSASGTNTRGSKVTEPGRLSKAIFKPALASMRLWISSSGSVRASSAGSSTKTISGTGRPAARPISPASSSAIRALGPCPAPRNLSTYKPSSSASMIAGRDPPSRSGVTYRLAVTALNFIVPQAYRIRRRRIACGGAVIDLDRLSQCIRRAAARLPARPQRRLNCHGDFILIAWLRQSEYSERHGVPGKLRVACRQDDGKLGISLLKVFCELQPRHCRHGMVRDDHVDPCARGELG